MRNVLADLALESEASMALALGWRAPSTSAPTRGAGARGHAGRQAVGLQRAVAAVAECLEAWGGNGYVEDGPMPRLYRETPVNSVWEGSGNVMALDVLRVAARTEGMPRWRASWTRRRPVPRLRRRAGAMARQSGRPGAGRGPGPPSPPGWPAVAGGAVDPARAAAVADAFVGSRLAAGGGIFGELPAGADVRAILARAWPDAVAC